MKDLRILVSLLTGHVDLNRHLHSCVGKIYIASALLHCSGLCSIFRVKLGANDLNCVDVPLIPIHSLTLPGLLTVVIELQVRRLRPSCELSPCLNDGTCVDLPFPPYYRCICPQLRHDAKLPLGANCEPLSPCDSMPCPEHSTCVVIDETGDYRCVCDGKDCRHAAGAMTSLRPRDISGVYNFSTLIIVRTDQLILSLT